MNCEFCESHATLRVEVADTGVKCGCGEKWTPDDVLICSTKCFNQNAYWELHKHKGGWTLGVEDECNGCGLPLVGDVKVVLHQV